MVVLVVIVLLGLDIYKRYVPAARALRDGRDAATQAEAILKGNLDQLDHGRVAQAQQLLQEAEADFGDRSTIVETGWILSIASHLPFLGDQVDGIRSLRSTGLAASRLGSDLLPIVDAALPEPGAAPGGTLARVTAIAEGRRADLDRITAELDDLNAAALRIPSSAHLIGPLASGRDIVRREVPRIDGGVRPAIGLLRLLPAAVGTGPHRYLLLLDNPAEERPGGGFIGALGEVVITSGKVTEQTFRSSDFANSLVTSIKPPRPLADYLFGTHPWELSDANWSPDFPTSADEVAHFYTLATGHTVDGVIGVDPVALGGVLGVIGTVTVPQFPQTVGAQDTLLILNEIINKARPGDPGKEFLAPFGQAVLTRMLAFPISQSAGLASVLTAGAAQKHIVMHFNDAGLQAAVDGAGYGGRVVAPASDALQVVDANLSGSKTDLVVTRRYALVAKVGPDGEVSDTLTLTYRNPVVSDPAIKILNAQYGGAYHDYLRVYIPETAHVDGLTLSRDGGQPVVTAPETVDFELQREAVAVFLDLPPGHEVTLTMTYSGPFADATGSSVHYALVWAKEIGAATWPESVVVVLPSGRTTVNSDTSHDRTVDLVA